MQHKDLISRFEKEAGVLKELCPYCNNETRIIELFIPQLCLFCFRVIKPCSLCDLSIVKCNECELDKKEKRI